MYVGHGGRKFIIQKDNESKPIVTHNLWCQGDVPRIWANELPDNAKFLKDESLDLKDFPIWKAKS
ncbi:MAG: hypothetical protein AB8G11_16695 [Saprospiraceae bacterium]